MQSLKSVGQAEKWHMELVDPNGNYLLTMRADYGYAVTLIVFCIDVVLMPD